MHDPRRGGLVTDFAGCCRFDADGRSDPSDVTQLLRARLANARAFPMGPVTMIAPSAGVSRVEGGLAAAEGRVDNATELASAFPGVDASGHPAAVLAPLLKRHGIEALARVRGVFSCAFWDQQAGRLLLVADPLGRRTVYHTRIDGQLVFSSSLRTLLALPGVARDLDEPYLAAFLSDVIPEPEATLYAAIRRVPAACAAAVGRDGTLTFRTYWQLDFGRRIRHRHDDTYVEEARALLDQAVARQLRGLDPVVCDLSSGLDSGAVASTAARLRAPGIVHALTLTPPDGVPRYERPTRITDERAGAKAVAALYPNMAWEAVSSPELHAFDQNPLHLFLTLSGPARNVMNIGWFARSMDRARALGARAVLNGTFGNMTLSWDGLSGLASMARRGDWLRLWREAAARGRSTGRSTVSILRQYALRPLLSPRLQSRIDDYRGRPRPECERFSAMHPEFAQATAINARRLDMSLDYPADTETMRRRWLRRAQTFPSWDGPLQTLFGVEMRDPMADLDLLEFCFAVPDEQYLRDGTTRWLARRVLADRMPQEVVNDTRMGLQCAEFLHRMTLQRDQIIEGVEALERSPLASRILDVARMKRLAADWPTDAANTSFADYGAVLHRGLHYGQFLRWMEGGNG